jgi:hypothetical protein
MMNIRGEIMELKMYDTGPPLMCIVRKVIRPTELIIFILK